MFYLKLALNNLGKNKKIYVPFLLSMIFLVVINVVMQVLLENKGMDTIHSASAVKAMFGLGSIILMIFSAIFSLYTNGFLLKQRKKELGLFNILGMGKKELTQVLFFETLLSLLVTLGAGVLSGVLFSKFSFLVLKKLLGAGVDFEFELSPKSLVTICLLFLGIYSVLFILNTFQLRRVQPLALMRESQAGEKEPKANWLLGMLGLVLIGIGYYLSVVIVSPLAALNVFFTAVVLVIIGTYALFTSSSILILKMLKRNKRFYYQPNHFITVSNMMYRMKQNAMGLASISILCTMVLVTLSSTMSLFIGSEDVNRNQNPYDISISMTENQAEFKTALAATAEAHQVTITQELDYQLVDGVFLTKEGDTYQPLSATYNTENVSRAVSFQLMPLGEYNRLTQQALELGPTEVLYYPVNHQKEASTFVLGESAFSVKAQLSDLSFMPTVHGVVDLTLLVMADLPTIAATVASLDSELFAPLVLPSTQLLVNIKGSEAQRLAFAKELQEAISAIPGEHSFSSFDLFKEEMHGTTVGFLFLGLVFGLTFTLATGIIIYYKQVSEGLQDTSRFEIMQRVGMSHAEVKQTIGQQVLMVFFFPLALAASHLAFSMPVVQKLLLLFGLANKQLYLMISIGVVLVFLVIYLVMYALTSKVYYQLVERQG